ncbi:MAG: DUF4860 domain-containing protein [Coriobacteriales bacterium]|jgi:hypothetical protein|nr:DUF4860 domain-containing protein [Coriobacteriales bacterium]
MRRHSLDLVVVVALFFVYATSALFLCIIGAEVYRDTAEVMQNNYNQRTSALYVAEKVRQNDLSDALRVDSVEGAPALVLIEKRSGQNYETWLFVQDRTLYEGLFAPGDTVDPKLCQPIMPMASLVLKQDGPLVNATFYTLDGQATDVNLWLRTQRGTVSDRYPGSGLEELDSLAPIRREGGVD